MITQTSAIASRLIIVVIAKALDAEMYSAHSCASYERGLNENTNRLLHQLIPTGADQKKIYNAIRGR